MRVSIITPFQRGRNYLADCLDSLQEQTYRDFELLLILDHPTEEIDDLLAAYPDLTIRVLHLGSKEVTPAIMQTFADQLEEARANEQLALEEGRKKTALQYDQMTPEEYRLFVKPYQYSQALQLAGEPTGVSAARNLGLREAEGELVYFLDSDDYLFPEALEELVTRLDEREADVVFGKKRWTWYSRAGYLAELAKKEAERLARLAEQGLDASAEYTEDADEADEEDETGDSDDSSAGDDGGNAEDDSDDIAADDGTGDVDSSAEEMTEEEELTEEEMAAREERRVNRMHRQAVLRLISKRKGLRNVSILHILIRKEIFTENNITFNENLRYFADLRVVGQVIEASNRISRNYRAKYVKRKHGDPIHFPSIAQEKAQDKFDQMILAFEDAMDVLPDESRSKWAISRKLIRYYTGYYVTRMRRSKNDHWRDTRYDTMRRVIGNIDPVVLKSLRGYRKKHVKALLKNNQKRTMWLVNFRLGRRKLKRFFTKKHELAKYLYLHNFMEKPVMDNWVLCECFFGKSYGDNPKALYEYMQKTFPGKYKFIWCIDNKDSKIPYDHIEVKRFSIQYAYYVARCKYFIFNVHQPGFMRKRPGQVFLETWHGTPLKRLAFDIEDNFSSTPGYKQKIYKQARQWDYLVSANRFSTDVFRSCFQFNGPMLEYGYPRNDILHQENRDAVAKQIREKIGIPADKKTILYAPTFRDNEYYAAGQYKFELKLDLAAMKEALGDEYVLLLRTHYYIADHVDVTGMEDFVFNLSKYDDISELYLISDLCITDYSSVFFDYGGLKRPMLFYTYDLENYRGILRGFYFNMEEEVPGPMLFTTEEVIDAIKNIDTIREQYKDKYDAFYEKFCALEDGHASENIVREVFD